MFGLYLGLLKFWKARTICILLRSFFKKRLNLLRFGENGNQTSQFNKNCYVNINEWYFRKILSKYKNSKIGHITWHKRFVINIIHSGSMLKTIIMKYSFEIDRLYDVCCKGLKIVESTCYTTYKLIINHLSATRLRNFRSGMKEILNKLGMNWAKVMKF